MILFLFFFVLSNREQLRRDAKFKGLTTCLIRDASMSNKRFSNFSVNSKSKYLFLGQTKFNVGRRTVLGIGPG